MTVEKLSTRNCARKWNFIILINGRGINPESVLENEIEKVLWDFEIQMDLPIQARRLDLILIKKKKKPQLAEFVILADQRVKVKESEKLEKYFNFARK